MALTSAVGGASVKPAATAACQGSQFLIATYSPILMAYPHATIYSLADTAPRRVDYRETERFTVTRDLLTRTDRMLAILLDDQDEA